MSADPNSIRVFCTGCSKTIKVAAKFAGKRIRCPKCATVLAVPMDEGSADELDGDDDALAMAKARREGKRKGRRAAKASSSSLSVPLAIACIVGFVVCGGLAIIGLYSYFAARPGRVVEYVTGIDIFPMIFGRTGSLFVAIFGVVGGLLFGSLAVRLLKSSTEATMRELPPDVQNMVNQITGD